MKKLSEYLFLWAIGGTLYYVFEIIFRGFSHWSMFVLGGICMIFCVQQGLWVHWQDPIWQQVLHCIIFITCGEFITGILVNKILHWNVWDYSGLPFQLFGQICLPFAAIFSLLCLVAIYLGAYLSYHLYGEEKPPFLNPRKMV
ncbi:MAG: hypothetical protein HFH53_06990 [Hespellia sp.]|nr:hypothetical protein [Hespellia sp.]